MKKLILILTLVFTASIAFCQVDSVINKAKKYGSEIIKDATSDSAKITMNKVYEDVKYGLQGLASALKTGVEHVYIVLVKQQIVNAITNVIITFLLFLCPLFYIVRYRKWAEEKNKQGGSDGWIVLWFFTTIAPMVCGLIFFLATAQDTVMGFVNPEYGALQNIFEFVKTIKK